MHEIYNIVHACMHVCYTGVLFMVFETLASYINLQLYVLQYSSYI